MACWYSDAQYSELAMCYSCASLFFLGWRNVLNCDCRGTRDFLPSNHAKYVYEHMRQEIGKQPRQPKTECSSALTRNIYNYLPLIFLISSNGQCDSLRSTAGCALTL